MSNTIQTSGQLATTTPPNIAVIGPGLQYTIIANGSGGQFAGLNLPPVSLSASNTAQTVDIGLVDSGNHTVQFSAMNPTVYSLTDGRVYLQGTSSALAQGVTVKAQIMGRQADLTGYLVISITNTGASTLTLQSVVLSLLSVHFCQSRYFNITASTGDTYAYDGTNNNLNLSNSGVTGVTIDIASNYGALGVTQHYKVTDTSYDPLAEVVSNGHLADSISGTATATKCAYLAIGDSTHTLTIASNATLQCVFMLTTQTTKASADTLMANAKSGYSTDITTFNGYAAATRLTQSSGTSLDALLDYLLMKTAYNAKNSLISGYTFSPAGAYTFFSSFCRDSSQGVLAISQTGNTSTVSDIVALFLSVQGSNHSQYHEIVNLLTTSGFNLASHARNGTPGDCDAFVITMGYEYYVRTLDATWLTNNIAALNNIGTFLLSWYGTSNGKSTDGAFCASGNMTYLDSSGNITGQTYCVDPVMMSILIYALRCLTELNTAAGNTALASLWSGWRDTLITIMPALWNSTAGWPIFNKTVDGTSTYNNIHLMKIDALIFDALQDTVKQRTMLGNLAGAGSLFWDATDVGFYMMPTSDSNYSAGSYWNGPPWHIGDYKAFSTCFRYGTAAQAQWAWTQLQSHVSRVLNTNIFCPGEHFSNVGLFDFASGAYVEMIVRGLWGIDAHAAYFTISPNIYKLGLGGTWTLTSFQMGGSTWTITCNSTSSCVAMTLDGSPVSGKISYPSAGSHTLAITAGTPSFSMVGV